MNIFGCTEETANELLEISTSGSSPFLGSRTRHARSSTFETRSR